MGGGLLLRLHLPQHHGDAPLGQLPGTFAPGQARADHSYAFSFILPLSSVVFLSRRLFERPASWPPWSSWQQPASWQPWSFSQRTFCVSGCAAGFSSAAGAPPSADAAASSVLRLGDSPRLSSGRKFGALGIDAEGLVEALAGLLEHGLAAHGAVVLHRHVPGHKIAGRPPYPAVSARSRSRCSRCRLVLRFRMPSAALGAAARHLHHQRLGELALRDSRGRPGTGRTGRT